MSSEATQSCPPVLDIEIPAAQPDLPSPPSPSDSDLVTACVEAEAEAEAAEAAADDVLFQIQAEIAARASGQSAAITVARIRKFIERAST